MKKPVDKKRSSANDTDSQQSNTPSQSKADKKEPLIMYAKVFKTMFDGTLRGRSDALLVFVNLLANSDPDGFVDMHPRAVADETGLPLERVKAALIELESPDPESRTKELDGRRLTRMDDHREWGWLIVNYLKYRNIRNEADRRDQNKRAQAIRRGKDKLIASVSAPSAPRQHQSAQSANGEVASEASKEGVPLTPVLRISLERELRSHEKRLDELKNAGSPTFCSAGKVIEDADAVERKDLRKRKKEIEAVLRKANGG